MHKMHTLLLRCCQSDFQKLMSGEITSRYLEGKSYWEKKIIDREGKYKVFDTVHIKNGYTRDAPELYFTYRGCHAVVRDGVKYYEILLGKRL